MWLSLRILNLVNNNKCLSSRLYFHQSILVNFFTPTIHWQWIILRTGTSALIALPSVCHSLNRCFSSPFPPQNSNSYSLWSVCGWCCTSVTRTSNQYALFNWNGSSFSLRMLSIEQLLFVAVQLKPKNLFFVSTKQKLIKLYWRYYWLCGRMEILSSIWFNK